MINNNVKNTHPLIHCITNYVTVNDVANILLSSGASPAMADCIEEVRDLASIASALYLNIGTPNKRTLESMIVAAKTANEKNIPVVLDPVAVGVSAFRKLCVSRILNETKVDVIRGNISEIKAIALNQKSTSGVDAQIEDQISSENITDIISLAKNLSKQTNAIIAISGKQDIICDASKYIILNNGNSMMANITGAGCMLTALITAHVASSDDKFSATVTAMAQMGIAGEIARELLKENEGNSTYRNHLIDTISFLDTETIKDRVKYGIL